MSWNRPPCDDGCRLGHHGRAARGGQRRSRLARQHASDRSHLGRADPGVRTDLWRAFQSGRIAGDELAQRPSVARILPLRGRANCRRLHWDACRAWNVRVALARACDQSAHGPAQWFAEFVATFGLIVTILAVSRFKSEAIPVAVGLYITAAYWFTASTSFANPAVTIARALTNSFSGIAPADVPMFIVAQFVGALAGLGVMSWFFSASGVPERLAPLEADLVRWATVVDLSAFIGDCVLCRRQVLQLSPSSGDRCNVARRRIRV